MKRMLLKSSLAVIAAVSSVSAIANPRAAMLIGATSVDAIENFQEYAAARYFTNAHPDGVVIAPGETSKISTDRVSCIWIHIDRVNIGKGNLPAEFSDAATIEALRKFVADGGSLLLTKQATQLTSRIGRVDAKFDPNIFSDGDGGNGTDVWTINAHIGYWFAGWPDSDHFDLTQYYDRNNHPIYAGLTTMPAHHEYANFETDTYAMEGTGNGTEMWREDHNCVWDLNAYAYTSEGKNTVERFEKDNNATVLGTWGHVIDHAVAGIVEYHPEADGKGTILANGLATCEWSPRTGVNAYHDNLEKLTSNCLSYLIANSSGVAEIVTDSTDADAPAEYYNLQGMRVAADALTPGIYVMRQGNTTSKIIVR